MAANRKQVRKARAERRSRRPGRRLLTRGVGVAFVLALLLVGFTALFIGVTCYNSGVQAAAPSANVQRVASEIPHYLREGSATYLTLPEWHIVYSTEEYAAFIEKQPPSQFPYAGSIHQYWRTYGSMCGVTQSAYPFNSGVHLMLGVIGASFTVENGLKGLYENTVGRLSEWAGSHDSAEDAFAARTAREYGKFLHTTPWYSFPFGSKLLELWSETPLWGDHPVRKWERRIALSAEYAIKAAYGWLIKQGTAAAYAPEDLEIFAWIDNGSGATFADPRVKKVREMGPGAFIIKLPRYEEFTEIVTKLAASGVRFVDIAGNQDILVTALAPSSWQNIDGVLFAETILTNPATKRVGIKVPVRLLHQVLPQLQRDGATIEHLYDY